MSDTAVVSVFEAVANFLASEPSYDELMSWYLPDALQARADDLAERNGEGLLTVEEERELEEFVSADIMVTLVKTKARLRRHKDGR